MKGCKYIAWLAASSLALVLTQCASVQEAEAPRRARASFEVYATPAETRTVNDGMDTRWETGDRFSLFHAAAGTTSYVADGAFTIDAPATGHAWGAVTGLTDGVYDWYMAYPYAPSAESPASVPITVGAPADGQQVQQGKDSRAHLAGEGFPLGGKAQGVSHPGTPVLTAAPLVSVIAVNVTNPGEGVVKVTSIRFKAPEAIVGTFRVDVTGAAPVFQAENATDEALLSVAGNAYVRAGESAVFYLGIKPFTAPAGSTLTLTVNDQERTVTLPRDYTFSAGMIKTLNVTLDVSEPTAEYYFKRVDQITSGRKYILVAEDTKQGGLRLAGPLPEGTASGNLPAETVTEQEDELIVLDIPDNMFVFTQTDHGYTIRQRDGRYLYNGNRDILYAGTDQTTSYYWNIVFDGDGLATIQNAARRLQYNPTSTVQQFQARQSSSTVGRNPWLYELLNDTELLDEFAQQTVPGVYGYDGFDWLYVDGTSQTSVRTLAGTTAFRIFYPAEFAVIQVTGIPASPVLNDRFPIRFVRYVKQAATHADNFTVTAVKVEDGKAWLLTDDGTGFLVQIQ